MQVALAAATPPREEGEEGVMSRDDGDFNNNASGKRRDPARNPLERSRRVRLALAGECLSVPSR